MIEDATKREGTGEAATRRHFFLLRLHREEYDGIIRSSHSATQQESECDCLCDHGEAWMDNERVRLKER
jgi:hypothetical protein